MNSIANNPAETEPDIGCMTTETSASEDMYLTTPLVAIHSIYRQPNEDELHSSFEEAISDRVLAFNRQFRHLSFPVTDEVTMQSSKRPLVNLQSEPTHFILLRPGFRQAMLLITTAFMLLMVGFDVMGLLILLKF